MRGAEFAQLQAFVAVAERCNFREAADHLGLAPSTLSQTIRSLEDRLDVRLLNRTTRSVRLTQAGELLLARLKPLLHELSRSVDAVSSLSDHQSGRVRLVASRSAARLVLAPLVGEFCRQYPNIEVELTVDDSITNIVESDFDAGVRVGNLLEKDMVALPLTPAQPVCVVASPGYIAEHGRPGSPRELRSHRCVRTGHSATGVVFPWRFRNGAHAFEFMPSGNLTINDETAVVEALLKGAGIGYMLAADARSHIVAGRLVSLLEGWTVALPGFYIYYVRTRHMPGALRLLLDFLKEQRDW